MSDYSDSQTSIVPVDREVSQPEAIASNRQHVEQLAQEFLELKLEFLSESDRQLQQVRQLRRQVGVLTWILGAAIAVLGGVFLWLGYTLKVEQTRLSQQVQSSGDRQELAQLQQQIDSLRRQIPDNLDGDLAANRDRLEALESRIEAIATDVQTRSQTLAVLTRALQDLIEVQSPASTATSPDPDPSRDRADAEDNMTDTEADESNAEGE